MTQFTTLTSHIVPMPVNDVDTDQIIPARYLKATDKAGMGEALFADWRYNPDGSPIPGFILNGPGARGAQILLAGNNFGCGSSREHAPWALTGYGFRAIISTSFADIFRNNALKNGLLPIIVEAADHHALFELVAAAPDTQIEINLATQTIHLPDGRSIAFPIDPFAKTCLLRGVDELSYLLGFSDRIVAYEQRMGIIAS